MADGLGIGPDDLRAEVSLTDDLAADSLDLLELVLVAETEFAIAVPERAIDDVRTYGDLVRTVTELVLHRRRDAARFEPAPVWARVIPAGRDGAASVERALPLTPYAVETIADDALHAGRGARLEVDVPASASDLDLAAVQDRFAGLVARGVQVSVRRRAAPVPPISDAASASQ